MRIVAQNRPMGREVRSAPGLAIISCRLRARRYGDASAATGICGAGLIRNFSRLVVDVE